MSKVILASNSPRRKEILENIGIKFSVIGSDVDEIVRDNESPESVVMGLSFEKAVDVSKKADDGAIVIAADTIVYGDKILGKPVDKADAFNMLKALSGKSHYVYTGISVIKAGTNTKVMDYVKTEVVFKELDDDIINKYIETGEPMDKAGAYAIQGYGSILIESISGDYFNVVGLPISRLSEILKGHFDFAIL